jgi:pseudaminic acid biosynthesis-associated methylase
MDNTRQEEFWQSEFGQEYTERNEYSTPEKLDEFYTANFGVSRTEMNNEFLHDLAIDTVLEAGCNIGNQLNLLQTQGLKKLYGFDIQEYAVERAKAFTKNINIIQASIFDIPFKDNYFDLVFTAGVLIHISPDDLPKAMQELCRVSKRYVWGYEYYAPKHVGIPYRGNVDKLWKGNFSEMYTRACPELSLVKEKKYSYTDSENEDVMFLLEKMSHS